MIKNFTPQLLHTGSVKVGFKGEKRKSKAGKEFRLPQKTDHFLITKTERGSDDNFILDTDLIEKLKADQKRPALLNKDGNIIGIPIRLLHNCQSEQDMDLIFYTRYAYYNGSQCQCEGDGHMGLSLNQQSGKREKVKCTCHLLNPNSSGARKCKPNGCLTFLIDQAEYIGGCFRFRTTSFRTISSIMGSLYFLQNFTGGNLAFLPLYLMLVPQAITIPNGGQTTIPVVSIVFKGSVDELQTLAFKQAQSIEFRSQQFGQVKELALSQIKSIAFDSTVDDSQDFSEEFYPENSEEFYPEKTDNEIVTQTDAMPSGELNFVTASQQPDTEKQQQPEQSPAQYTGAKTDLIGDDPERKLLKKIHAQVSERGYDRDGVKIAMQNFSRHPKGKDKFFPFRVESTKLIQVQHVPMWADFLTELTEHHKLFVDLGKREQRTPGLTEFIKQKMPEFATPVNFDEIGHWYCLLPRTINFINKNLDKFESEFIVDTAETAETEKQPF